MERLSLSQLEPGIYQIAGPEDIEETEVIRELEESVHFWLDQKSQKLHCGQIGLRLQAGAIGLHVDSKILEANRRYCLAEATGSVLWPDGTLEVYRRRKEYDLDVELFHASLKKLGGRQDQVKPEDKTSKALVAVPTEQTALALVAQLPPLVQADVMRAQLEVQTNRLALCCSKAENQVIRYFLGKAGGVLQAKAGCGTIKVRLWRAILKRRLTPQDFAQAITSLYGGAVQPEPTPAPREEEEPDEATDILRHEADIGTDEEEIAAAEAESAAPAPGPSLFDSGQEQPQPAPKPEEEPGPGERAICQRCGSNRISAAQIEYCLSEKGQRIFNGSIYCWDCQQAIKHEKGLPTAKAAKQGGVQ